MQKLKGLKNTLYQDLLSGYSLDLIPSELKSGTYSIKCVGKKLEVRFKDERGELNALSFLNRVDPSDWINYEGLIHEKYPERALYITRPFSKDLYDLVASKIASLGFTHVITEVKDEALFDVFHEYGLKYGLAGVKGDFPHDFYYANSVIGDDSPDLLFSERIIKEIESHNENELWFELPKYDFNKNILNKIDIYNKRYAHLILETLDPLREIKHLGSPLHLKVNLERGLWPVLTHLDFEPFISGIERHPIKGLIVKTPFIPGGAGFSELNLWALAQAQIRGDSLEKLTLSWLKKVKGKDFNLKILKEMTRVSSELGQLNPGKAKILGAKLLNEIILIEEDSKGSPLENHARLFTLDARRILAHFLQENNVHLTYVLRDEDFQNSFYTEAYSMGGSSVKTAAKISLVNLSEPLKYEGKLKELFLENSLF